MISTILPSHRPAIEKAIDLAAADSFEGRRSISGHPEGLTVVDIDVNPLTCTPEVLQVLAYSYKVDISGLELEQQRQLVSKAFLINRHKGTRFAVDEVLKVMFRSFTLEEEIKGEPFVFKITVHLEETETFTPMMYSALIRVLDGAKNARSHLKGVDIAMPRMDAVIYEREGFMLTIEGEQKPEVDPVCPVNGSAGLRFKI